MATIRTAAFVFVGIAVLGLLGLALMFLLVGSGDTELITP